MSFTSLQFALFVFICVIAYYIFPLKYRWTALFFANFVFYYAFGKRRLACMLLSALSAWFCALCIDRLHIKEKDCISANKESLTKEEKNKIKAKFKHKKQFFFWSVILLNIFMLAFFKFYPMLGAAVKVLPKFNLLVPVGISFYTLQVLGYVIYVYNKKGRAEQNPLKVILFTMYFPQIIEGPISRFDQISDGLFKGNSFDYDNILLGLERIIWGYFKKLVIADRLYVAVATIFGGYEKYFGFEIFIGAMLYTIQLYADFSGGIDIALGVSQLFGVKLPENFKSPFFSKNIPEFWRRWHITLGAWLRDYLFYPVTFSKPLNMLTKFLSKNVSKWAGKWIPAYIALLILWFTNGLWHGEGLQFIAFGMYHGFLVILGMSFAPAFDRVCSAVKLDRSCKSWQIFSTVRTFALVCIGELIFRSSSLKDALAMLSNMFAKFNPYVFASNFINTLGLSDSEILIAVIAVSVMLIAEYFSQKTDMYLWIKQQELPLRWLVIFAGITAVFVFGAYGPKYAEAPFIYFQF